MSLQNPPSDSSATQVSDFIPDASSSVKTDPQQPLSLLPQPEEQDQDPQRQLSSSSQESLSNIEPVSQQGLPPAGGPEEEKQTLVSEQTTVLPIETVADQVEAMENENQIHEEAAVPSTSTMASSQDPIISETPQLAESMAAAAAAAAAAIATSTDSELLIQHSTNGPATSSESFVAPPAPTQEDSEPFPATQTSTHSSDSSRHNSAASPAPQQTFASQHPQTVSTEAFPSSSQNPPVSAKTPRRLTAHASSASSGTSPADSLEQTSSHLMASKPQAATPSSSVTTRDNFYTKTPIAPKITHTPGSVLIAPKSASNGDSIVTPVSHSHSMSHPTPSHTSPSSTRKRPQTAISTPSAGLASRSVSLGPQSRPPAILPHYNPRYMSTYKKKTTASPRRNSNEMTTGLYTATYSDIPVFEMMVKGVAVMRRRQDSSLNATQILKVAGVDKSKRTKILEREILTGAHEKVQGGYGKYQGTWIPYDRGVSLCRQYSVYDALLPLLEFDASNPAMENTPTKEQAMAAQRKKNSSQPPPQNSFSGFPSAPYDHHVMDPKAVRMESMPLPQTGMFYHPGPNPSPYHGGQLAHPSYSMPPQHPDHSGYIAGTPIRGPILEDGSSLSKRQRMDDYDNGAVTPSRNIKREAQTPPGSNNTIDQIDDDDDYNDDFVFDERLIPENNSPMEPLDTNSTPFFESSKEVINHIFLDNVTDLVQLFGSEEKLRCFALDIPFDDQGNTALHWAAALGRIELVKELIRHGAERLRANYNGESALIRAVNVTNNFENHTFARLIDLLYPAIPLVDKQGRSVLHHIAATASLKQRGEAAKYYLSCLLEWIVRKGMRGSGSCRLSLGSFIKTVLNIQDKNGDTALNIAARVGNRSIAQQLLKVGADANIANRAGLKPVDFGVKSLDVKSDAAANQTNGDGLSNGLDVLATSSGGSTNSSYSTAVQDSIRKAKSTQQEVANNIRIILGELQTSFEEELVAKDESIQQLHVKLRDSNKRLDEVHARLAKLRTMSQDVANYQRRAQNLESAVVEEDQRFKAEEQRQGRPIVGGIDYEGKFDADQPFKVSGVVALYEAAVKEEEEGASGEGGSIDEDKVRMRVRQEVIKKLQESASQVNGGSGDTEQSSSSSTTPPPTLASLPPKALLRARIRAYRANERRLEDFAQELKSRSVGLEEKCRRVISLCTDVEEPRVDSLLEQLLQAVESDPGEMDMARVAGFLRKMDDET